MSNLSFEEEMELIIEDKIYEIECALGIKINYDWEIDNS